jgi:hypothetical protein
MSAQASALTISVHRFHPAGDYRSSFPVMKARRLAAATMAAPRGRTEPGLVEARGVSPAFGRRERTGIASNFSDQIKQFGKTAVMFRAINAAGEVV